VTGARLGYRFAIIPEWVLYHPDLTPLAVRVYGCLARHGMDPDSCFPSHERIARLVGVDERSVARPVRQLVAVGAIAIRRRDVHGRRSTNGYWLAGDEPFEATDRRAGERGSPDLPRSTARTYRAAARAKGKPANEIPTCSSPESCMPGSGRVPTPKSLRLALDQATTTQGATDE
jgi:hypothetical protein